MGNPVTGPLRGGSGFKGALGRSFRRRREFPRFGNTGAEPLDDKGPRAGETTRYRGSRRIRVCVRACEDM